MHHDRPVPHQLLQILRNTQVMGKETALMNTLWQSMTVDDEMKYVLSDTYISVREVESQYEMYKTIGIKRQEKGDDEKGRSLRNRVAPEVASADDPIRRTHSETHYD